MIDLLFWWTGVGFWLAAALGVGWAVVWLVRTAILTTIFTRRVLRLAGYRAGVTTRGKIIGVPRLWWSYFVNPPSGVNTIRGEVRWPGTID